MDYAIWTCNKCSEDINQFNDPPCVFKRPAQYVDEGRSHIWRKCPFGGKAKFKYLKDGKFHYIPDKNNKSSKEMDNKIT